MAQNINDLFIYIKRKFLICFLFQLNLGIFNSVNMIISIKSAQSSKKICMNI